MYVRIKFIFMCLLTMIRVFVERLHVYEVEWCMLRYNIYFIFVMLLHLM